MTLARTLAVGLVGVRAELVEVEADLSQGLPGMSFTGLADTSVVESRDRIRAAVLNCGADWPNRRITVALLPADLRKSGSRFDLALAVAVLAAAEEVAAAAIEDVVWIAELGLDGRLRPVHGVLPSVALAQERGVRKVIVAPGNSAEGALVPGVDVRVADDLGEVVAFLRGTGPALPAATSGSAHRTDRTTAPDLADVAGQALAKRAIEVAAAGGHHVFLSGPPGAGKTMLAERLPGLMPPLDDTESLEVSAVHSVAGLLGERAELIRRAPLQAPHHTATVASLVGGGSRLARPGAISLAHRGVLFLDEAAEFQQGALQALRQPLESGMVVVHRQGGAVRFPARFLLVLAANPCPCGARAAECECLPNERRRYQHKLSGPLLDRVDVRVQVEPVARAALFDDAASRESSAEVAARVATARAAAAHRWQGCAWRSNSEAPGSALRSKPWALPRDVLDAAEYQLERGQLSARGLDRVLRLAWTCADLAGRAVPERADVCDALYLRTGQPA